MPGKLSTHVLDLTSGRPAAGMEIQLSRLDVDRAAHLVKFAVTNADGRTDGPLLGPGELQVGRYELVFAVRDYFMAAGTACDFLDRVPVQFTITDVNASYHVPLLVTPWAYQTYRGS